MKCEMQEKVLEYLKRDLPDEEIEKHIDECEQCQALVEGYLAGEQEVELPTTEVTDKNLKERVEHYNSGRMRIVLFTIVGFIMGLYSSSYAGMDFLPLKIVIAIPYKISEILHVTLHEQGEMIRSFGIWNEFFPQSVWATFIGEHVMAAFVGGAIYGGLAYLTGDKKVFTLTRLMKFCAVWIVVLGAVLGSSFLVNDIAHKKNLAFENISGFFILYESGGSGVYEDNGSDEFSVLCDELFSNGKLALSDKERNIETEETMQIYFRKNMGYMLVYVNLYEDYMIADDGNLYEIPESFCDAVKDFQEEKERENGEGE